MSKKDPIEEILARRAKAENLDEDQVINTIKETSEEEDDEVVEEIVEDLDFGIVDDVDDDDDDPYGIHDREKELEEEDAMREQALCEQIEARQKRADEAEEKKTLLPPEHGDIDTAAKQVDTQANELADVEKLIKFVADKYKITEGEVPVDKRFTLIGELRDLYYEGNGKITPAFENLLLENIIMPTGETAAERIKGGSTPKTEEKKDVVVDDTTDKVPEVTINIEKSETPVNVNIDESLTANLSEKKEINITIKEVTRADMKYTKVIENSSREDVISTYESGFNDVPLTLPMSAYRCVIKPMTFLDFIKLSAPSSGNFSDVELKNWTIIYNHIKNVSIGPFKDFEEFLKLTKYQDREYLMWGLLVSTADDQEDLPIRCTNVKCQYSNTIKYYPRDILHFNDDKIPSYFAKTHNVPTGLAAREHCEQVANFTREFELPDSKVIVETYEPSAWDFINTIFPEMERIYSRFRPNEPFDPSALQENDMAEYDFLISIIMYIKSMSIVDKSTQERYRYTHIEDFEKIMSTAISTTDSGVIIALIKKLKEETDPVSFYVADYECPKCHTKTPRIVINNIANTLIFQLSRRLENTQISLIDMPEKC